jgi:hypothetical protein
MHIAAKKKIVLLGMMSKMPVAGNAWLAVQYLIGFQRLGYDVYYVEAHGCTPRELMEHEHDDGCLKAARYIERILRRFDLHHAWAYHSPSAEGQVYGMTKSELRELYRSAELVINLHGGTVPLPEHSETGRLIYLGTDPVEAELEVFHGVQQTSEFLSAHAAFFTWGLNYGRPDCKLPYVEQFEFRPSPPPVLCDFWQHSHRRGDMFTTIGNWRQLHRDVLFQGEVYYWSKHHEYLKFLDLPRRTSQKFELALSSYIDEDRRLLEAHGWNVRPSMPFSADLDRYRDYLAGSRGEFTVAKDQNVRLRTGWFSERSAQYLACGRPVITQDTGFGRILPTGQGLFAFSTLEDILAAVEAVNGAYEKHCRAAAAIAHEVLSCDVVLRKMLLELGLSTPRSIPRTEATPRVNPSPA